MADVMALARVLASKAVWDWVCGESWYGQFDSSDPDEFERVVREWTPDYVETARRYLKTAGIDT